VTTRAPAPPRLAVIAFDHRTQFEELAAQSGAEADRIERFKRLIAQAADRVADDVGGHRSRPRASGLACGLIVDDRYGAELLPELDEAGWWIARPVEMPGSRPLRFEDGNVVATLRRWPVQHVAKCLVAFDADDDPAMLAAQLEALRDLARACEDTQRELLLEVIPPGREPDSGGSRDSDEKLTRALARITAAGVLPDWWKLPPPARLSTWTRWREVILGADPHCRGVLLLGLDAPLAELGAQIAEAAAQPLCRGFAVGRSIFGAAARDWFERRIDDAAAIEAIAARYRQLLQRFADARSVAAAS
jgi:5-dehydro-2-deoxygluconokinase